MKAQNIYDVGIYCRLSRDDNNGNSESMSISNQRQMLINYIQERGWNLRECYVDDGYSGTTFDRPDFQRLIGDIEAKRINLVITKDLSRLGRNYVMTGQYTDFSLMVTDLFLHIMVISPKRKIFVGFVCNLFIVSNSIRRKIAFTLITNDVAEKGFVK